MKSVNSKTISYSPDPELLFKRISYTKISQEEFKESFQHELAAHPLSLFDEYGMRTTKKSSLYEAFSPLCHIELGDTVYVADGEFLLHRIVWHQHENFTAIIDRYAEYVKKAL